MSGVEVAGLALAVFPVLVDGMRRFTEGLETVKTWRWYRKEVSNYVRTMETARKYLIDTLTELFNGIVPSQDELMALVEDPAAVPWYEEQLKKRLDHNYDTYLATMTSMLDNLEIIRGKLGLDKNTNQVPWYNGPTLEREVKRIKIALSKKIYQELIGDIEKANRDLRDCTQQSIRLEPLRQRKCSPIIKSIDFKVIRRHAKSLFSALVSGSSWKCPCREYHGASLRLEARPWEGSSDQNPKANRFGLYFNVLLSTEDEEGSHVSPLWTWQEVDVRQVDLKTLGSGPMAAEDLNKDITDLSLNPQPKPMSTKKSVRFNAQAVQQSPTTKMNCFTQDLPYSEMRLITDLCTEVHLSAGVKDCLGLLSNGEPNHEGHVLFRSETRIDAGAKYRSLTSLLKEARTSVLGQRLSWENRLEVAVTLASSVLQLDGTSWLKPMWRSDDIFFLPPSGAKIGSRMDYAHPYVSWKICCKSTSGSLTPDATSKTAHRIRHDMLFALGVTLVELSLDQTLLELRRPEDIESVDALTNLNTAWRLEPYVYSERGPKVGDVVRRCLECPFDFREKSFDNPEFQDSVFDP